MKLALCLYNYFPYGGLQRDCLRIAKVCRDRGHEVHLYTMAWEGEKEPGMNLHLLPKQGRQNHSQCRGFANALEKALKNEDFDVVVGFNKMPNLDVYYAADVCYQARVREQRGLFYRMLPRYWQYSHFEKAVFNRGNKTEILLISPAQEKIYRKYYQTERERFHILPPGIDKSRKPPANADSVRKAIRDRYGLSERDKLILMVGSGFKTKGLDRSLKALSSLSDDLRKQCRLMVVGKDDPSHYQILADKLNIKSQVTFLGAREDVTEHMLSADLLLHPSYHENTGTVILEALITGLPVLTVDACGYAPYVEKAKAGRVLKAEFNQALFNQLLEEMLLSDEQATWRKNGLAFGKNADIYSMPEKAVDLIEVVSRRRHALS